MLRKNFPARKNVRKNEAAERQKKHDSLTVSEKLAALDPTGANKERKRLQAILDNQARVLEQTKAREEEKQKKKAEKKS